MLAIGTRRRIYPLPYHDVDASSETTDDRQTYRGGSIETD